MTISLQAQVDELRLINHRLRKKIVRLEGRNEEKERREIKKLRLEVETLCIERLELLNKCYKLNLELEKLSFTRGI